MSGPRNFDDDADPRLMPLDDAISLALGFGEADRPDEWDSLLLKAREAIDLGELPAFVPKREEVQKVMDGRRIVSAFPVKVPVWDRARVNRRAFGEWVLRETGRSVPALLAGEDSSSLPDPAAEWVSRRLANMNDAARQWWATVGREETPPTNAEVAEWLVTVHGWEPTPARQAASLIRPEWAPEGRPKKSRS